LVVVAVVLHVARPTGLRFRFATDVFLLAGLLTCVPIFSHKMAEFRGRPFLVFVESLMFIVVIACWAFWTGGPKIFGYWLTAVAAFVLILEIGSNLLQFLKAETSARVEQCDWNVSTEITANIDSLSRVGRLAYISVPLGLVFGACIALLRGHPDSSGLRYCYWTMIVLASLYLCYAIVNSFIQMCRPMFSRAGSPNDPLQDTRDFEAAMVITALRNVYLYETLHDVVLFGLLLAFGVSLLGISILHNWLISLLVAAAAVYLLNQLPYTIGQSTMHQAVVRGYSETKRAELLKKLGESAPVNPAPGFIAAQIGSGTVGALLFELLDHLLKEKLKGS
jgi:hypothetical protein